MVNCEVKPGDVYVKVDRVPSKWYVDRIVTAYDPIHVRLKEHGGNDRTATVSVITLLDERFWKQVQED